MLFGLIDSSLSALSVAHSAVSRPLLLPHEKLSQYSAAKTQTHMHISPLTSGEAGLAETSGIRLGRSINTVMLSRPHIVLRKMPIMLQSSEAHKCMAWGECLTIPKRDNQAVSSLLYGPTMSHTARALAVKGSLHQNFGDQAMSTSEGMLMLVPRPSFCSRRC